nr:RUN and RabGAP TBC domain containing protein [Haemonchus contortus]
MLSQKEDLYLRIEIVKKPFLICLRACSSPRLTRHGSVASVGETLPDEATKHRIQLLTALKKEVKVIMEEAVTKRQIDINSPYVTSLCVAVENCLMDGLRRRLLGLFGSRTSLALLHTIAKTNAVAEQVLAKTLEINAQTCSTHPLTWIREALHMRTLSQIVHHITVCPSLRRLYDNNALMLDRAKGGMVAALLLGPCAATYRRMGDSRERTAEELVRGCRPSSSSRPPLQITRRGSSIVSSDHSTLSRDFVYSLHHNFKSSLLYGKNNVCVANGDQPPVKGYLSLHKSYEGELSLRWTPNQLMHASSQPSSASVKDAEQQWLWKQALIVNMEDIIYIHLHQRDESSPSSLTLVNCDGVQCPPLQMSNGQQSLVFLATLESGLAPTHRLDPPLWSGPGKEKALPRLRKRTTVAGSGAMLDYVFRIVRLGGADLVEQVFRNDEEEEALLPPTVESHSLPASPYVKAQNAVDNLVTVQLDRACQSMRHQILARAFFGWLSYCRHLRTIRKHLMYLVDTREMSGEEDAKPVDEEFWKKCRSEKTAELEEEFLLRVYWKGIEGTATKELRRQAWPYLLKLFDWDEEPEPKMTEFTKKYREDVDSWRVLEAEVRRQDEEDFIAARHRRIPMPERECSMTSEVFEDDLPENGLVGKSHHNEVGDGLLKQFANNLHRIDKDVERCDRNLIFFSNKENLESLRRVMITYVRRNLEDGYIQGMCDILAPLLVIFEDEALTLECFTMLMARLRDNFPQRSGMDVCLMNLRSLIQVVDPQIFTMLTSTSDFTHLYFSYRWFLLDFKREMSYDCIFRVWETIWAATRTFTPHFPLFFALAMVTNYRDVIIANNMDFTDMIKFFNEMAERHDCVRLLAAARAHVKCLQNLVQHLR